jgi:hypothetical protein
MRDSDELSNSADMCEMDESLATAFVQLNARSERVNRGIDSNLASVLQTICDGLGDAVDTTGSKQGCFAPK